VAARVPSLADPPRRARDAVFRGRPSAGGVSIRARPPEWTGWLRRWDEQQESFNPERERRFTVMFDVLEATVGRSFAAIDLGSGPGSLCARLLARFPRATAVAVDYDPVTLRIGREALRSFGRRLTWVDAKLGAPGWTQALPPRRFDAAVSTTALHWLRPPALRRLYRDLGGLLKPRGVFLNGDHLPSGAPRSSWTRLDQSVARVRQRGASRDAVWSGWTAWWHRAARAPELRAEFREHKRRSAAHPHGADPSLAAHEQALRGAGFREVEVVWQDLDNRILFARRP
jgi:SAM-dependent methyltransferase